MDADATRGGSHAVADGRQENPVPAGDYPSRHEPVRRTRGGSTVIQKAVRPFSVFYVYTRDGNWLEVGASTTKPDGWIKATDTTAWNQALTLLFTDRSQRQPVLFFKDHKAIMDVCQAEDLPGSLSKLRAEAKAAQQGDAPADLPILAVEPDDAQGAVSRNRFYLMPILKVDTPFEGTKLLEVASIDPGSAGDKPDANAPKDAKDDGVPRTGIAMVIDTTISMKPYIDQSLNVVRAIFDSVAKDKLDDKVSFGIVAFRNSTKASPKLEYVTKVVSDFRDATKRDELEKALSGLEEAKASSHSFNEDSLAGVKAALDQLNWQPYANRVLLLITDAAAASERRQRLHKPRRAGTGRPCGLPQHPAGGGARPHARRKGQHRLRRQSLHHAVRRARREKRVHPDSGHGRRQGQRLFRQGRYGPVLRAGFERKAGPCRKGSGEAAGSARPIAGRARQADRRGTWLRYAA